MNGRPVVSTKGSQCRFPILIILECEMILWEDSVKRDKLDKWIINYNK
jgi:hypothetical protein